MNLSAVEIVRNDKDAKTEEGFNCLSCQMKSILTNEESSINVNMTQQFRSSILNQNGGEICSYTEEIRESLLTISLRVLIES